MGDKINVFFDDLHALLIRIIGLPLMFQLLFWVIIISFFWYFVLRMFGFTKWKLLTKFSKITVSVNTIIIISLTIIFTIVDYKWNHLENELLAYTPPSNNIKNTNNNKVKLTGYFDSFSQQLNSLTFGKTTFVRNLQSEKGLDIVQLKLDEPKISAFIVSVDLKKYKIVLDPDIQQKELTTHFAKQFNLDFAINGEAGTTPGLTAPLGQWTGNYIVEGKIVKLEDSKNRPFMYFNKKSKGFYSNDRAIIKTPDSNMYNAIWGRFDLIQNGKIAIDPADFTQNNPYPRTIMGIDKSGYRAFFLIADGRKPNYSLGMTMKMCGEVLVKVGAYSAMACDQGGSSMLYSKRIGIINKPADGGERPVYSHFGLKYLN